MPSFPPKVHFLLAATGSGILYFLLLYLSPRHEFAQVIGLFTSLFLLYGFFLRQKARYPAAWVLAAGIGFRLLAAFAIPELSDDYFRFIWDGRLMAHGINPFLQLPREIPAATYPELGISAQLFYGLNSPDYFTIYPPLCQAVFWVAALIAPNSTEGAVWVMKAFLLAAETGSLLLLLRLLRRWELPASWLALYALNPLVVVELCGNLHFEALMIFFLLLFLWVMVQGKWLQATLPFAMAVCSKLLPLIFLPLLVRRLGWLRSGIFASLVLLVTFLAFLPFLDLATLMHLLQSIELYFRSFEFNASVYYLVREMGFFFTGYNIIGVAGPILAGLSFLGILAIAIWERSPLWRNMPRTMLWVLMLYFGLATTVHPWYVCTLIALSSLTVFRFPMVWSAVIPLSYATYMTGAYHEHLGLVAWEYGILLGFMLYEMKKNQTKAFSIR